MHSQDAASSGSDSSWGKGEEDGAEEEWGEYTRLAEKQSVVLIAAIYIAATICQLYGAG